MADEGAPEIPSKKSRGLLHVPSRSSSNKNQNQPSPTSTGLSGATASDPSRESIGGRSKGSKSSILGRRNGSASSKMSITPTSADPTGNVANLPTSANANRSPKAKKGFLSFLNCCGVPDNANTIDPNENVPANKPTKITAGRPTTASRPDNSSVQQNAVQAQSEKDAFQQAEPEQKKEDTRTAPSGPNGELSQPQVAAREQPLPDLPKEAESSAAQAGRPNPSVIVQGPTRAESKRVPSAQASSQDQKDGDGDVQMEDPEPLQPPETEESTVPVPRKDEVTTQTTLPPPPPGPGPSEETAAPESTEQKQQWLLPPIAPRFQGKKCLVLDLDETLVHSSFKVHSSDVLIISFANNVPRFYTKQTLPFPSRSKDNITTST